MGWRTRNRRPSVSADAPRPPTQAGLCAPPPMMVGGDVQGQFIG